MNYLDTLPRMTFDGLPIPFKRLTIKGGLREHTHEFPHADGGAVEKLGRKLYTFNVNAIFLDEARGFTNLLNTVADLRNKFEFGRTGELVVPNIGTILAVATNWTETLDAKMRSGEEVEIEFLEDEEFLLKDIVSEAGYYDLVAAEVALQLEVAKLPAPPDLFAALADAVDSVAAIGDQVELMGNQIEARVRKVQSLCERIDRSLDILNKPVNHKLLDALHGVWEASVKLHANVLKSTTGVVLYTTPVRMSVSQVSVAVYGKTSRAVDIMRSNAIEDAFSIPAGVTLTCPAPPVPIAA